MEQRRLTVEEQLQENRSSHRALTESLATIRENVASLLATSGGSTRKKR